MKLLVLCLMLPVKMFACQLCDQDIQEKVKATWVQIREEKDKPKPNAVVLSRLQGQLQAYDECRKISLNRHHQSQ